MQFFTLFLALTSAASVFALNSFTAPSGGETLTTGEIYIIRWNNTDGGEKVDLFLKKGDSSNLQTALTIATDLTNAGAVRWSIPGEIESGNDYALEIVNKDNANDINYSPRFSISGGIGSLSPTEAPATTGANSTAAVITTTANANSTTAVVTTTEPINSTAVTTSNGTVITTAAEVTNTTLITTTSALNTTATSVHNVTSSPSSSVETSNTSGNFSATGSLSSSSTRASGTTASGTITSGTAASGTGASGTGASSSVSATGAAGGAVVTTAGPNSANMASYNLLLLTGAIAGVAFIVI